MRTNREKIEHKLTQIGLKVGCYDKGLETLGRKTLQRVMDNMDYGTTDVDVMVKGRWYVVEVVGMDLEVDFHMMTRDAYIDRYGDERWRDA